MNSMMRKEYEEAVVWTSSLSTHADPKVAGVASEAHGWLIQKFGVESDGWAYLPTWRAFNRYRWPLRQALIDAGENTDW